MKPTTSCKYYFKDEDMCEIDGNECNDCIHKKPKCNLSFNELDMPVEVR